MAVRACCSASDSLRFLIELHAVSRWFLASDGTRSLATFTVAPATAAAVHGRQVSSLISSSCKNRSALADANCVACPKSVGKVHTLPSIGLEAVGAPIVSFELPTRIDGYASCPQIGTAKRMNANEHDSATRRLARGMAVK